MRFVRKDEVNNFVKESLDYILKANKEKNIEFCVVGYPTFNFEGEFLGFKFGFIEEDLAEMLINQGSDFVKVIGSRIALNKENEISQIKLDNTKIFKKDGTEVEDLFEDYFEDECKTKTITPPYNKLEEIWYKQKVEYFLEIIEYIKKEIYKIN